MSNEFRSISFIIVLLFVIGWGNASLLDDDVLVLNSRNINGETVIIDLENINKIILDSEEIKFKVNFVNDMIVFVTNQNFYRVYKVPYGKKDAEILYKFNDVSAKIVLENIDVFVENYKKRNNETVLDIKSLLEGNYNGEDRIDVILKFSDEALDEVSIVQDVSSKELRKQVFAFSKQEMIRTLENETMKKNKIFSQSGVDKNNSKVKKFLSVQSSKYWVKREFKKFNGVSASLTAEEIIALEGLKYIEKVSIDKKVGILLDETTDFINATDVWALLDSESNNITGSGVVVAVVDTGIDYTHADFGSCSQSNFLNENCDRFVAGYNFADDNENPIDDEGHGTHVAGIIGANGNVVKGVAPDVKFMPVKVLDSYGSGTMSDVIAGIEYAIDPNADDDYSDGADIISLSLGGSGSPDDEMSQIVDFASNVGVTVVVAAGNSGPSASSIASPGVARKAITVGASCRLNQIGESVYCDSRIASFSSRGPTSIGEIKPDVVAPGVEICSTKYTGLQDSSSCIDSAHIAMSGTSMATPVVSGLAALILQDNPELTPEEVKSVLMLSSQDLDEDLNSQGAGEVNALRAIDTKIVVNPKKVDFGSITEDIYSANVTITNIDSLPVNVSVSVSNFTNELDEESDLDAILSDISFNISSGGSEVFNFRINTSLLDGFVSGKLLLSIGNDTLQVFVAYNRYSMLEIKLNDDVEGNLLYPYYVFVTNGDYISFTDMVDYDIYSAQLPMQNFSVIAIGDDLYEEFSYVLMDDVMLDSANKSIMINLSNSRDFDVVAKSFDNENLTLYEYDYGFNVYEDSESLLNGVMVYSYGIGDQVLKISNKPEFVNNLDVIVKYEGVPVR